MYDFDSYLLYEIKKRNVYSCKIKVSLTEAIDGDVLKAAAQKAFRRFPYFARKVRLNSEDAYILEPCEKPITVSRENRVIRLGTEETNDLLFAITYEGSDIFFNFAHNFCGGCGAMRWLKATLWQYLTDLGLEIDRSGIMTSNLPITDEECAEPNPDSLPETEPVGNFDFPGDAFVPRADYMELMKNPQGGIGYFPIIIPKKELMKYARDNDGSPNSILSAALFKMAVKVFPDEERFMGRIACNYREDVGCPETYRDMVRQLKVPYDRRMSDWPIEKLSTMTRSRMYIQMQPELSWAECRRVNAFRKAIDEQSDLESKADYAVKHSPTLSEGASTFFISYVGKVEWDGLAPYIKGVFSITNGHIMLEVNATRDDFCISFQTVRRDDKYLKEFTEVLDEEGISYRIGPLEDRNLPGIVLP
ncbi:MAG: hypothetical protein K5770_05675 [Lachnospiraceae bacterium]|nr:hypothetical protein [Lachnospiraceae bacterium]